eukprot:3138071-Amphidinium_carterae.1
MGERHEGSRAGTDTVNAVIRGLHELLQLWYDCVTFPIGQRNTTEPATVFEGNNKGDVSSGVCSTSDNIEELVHRSDDIRICLEEPRLQDILDNLKRQTTTVVDVGVIKENVLLQQRREAREDPPPADRPEPKYPTLDSISPWTPDEERRKEPIQGSDEVLQQSIALGTRNKY